jgi:hypothetical protein
MPDRACHWGPGVCIRLFRLGQSIGTAGVPVCEVDPTADPVAGFGAGWRRASRLRLGTVH